MKGWKERRYGRLLIVLLGASACGGGGAAGDAGGGVDARSEGSFPPPPPVSDAGSGGTAVSDARPSFDGLFGSGGGIVVIGSGGAGAGTGGSGPGGTGAGTGGASAGTGGAGGSVTGLAARLYSGVALPVLDGPSCTHEPGATGDRWCAFFAQGASAGAVDLRVVNVSKAAAGTAVTCPAAAGNADCLRLTASAYPGAADDGVHLTFFRGDTLIYWDNTTGNPYAWRPGMTSGRRLAAASATVDVFNCLPAVRGTAVLCLRSPVTPVNPDVFQTDLLVGRVEGTTDPALSPLLTGLPIALASDVDGLAHFGFDFSPDGQSIIWSSPTTPGGPEILNIQQIGGATSRRVVASDVSVWGFSADFSRWFWLSGFNYNRTLPTGRLDTVAIAGTQASATQLLANVTDYFPVPSGQVLALSGVDGTTGQGTLQAINPATAPAGTTMLDTDVLGVLNASAEGHVVYVRQFDMTTGVDLQAKKLDGASACAISDAPDSSQQTYFLPGGGSLLSARFSAATTEVRLTSLASCQTTLIASSASIAGMVPAGADGVLYVDDTVDDGVRFDGTLKLKRLTAAQAPSAEPALTIQTRVLPIAYTALPAPIRAVFFAASNGDAADGIYLYRWPGI